MTARLLDGKQLAQTIRKTFADSAQVGRQYLDTWSAKWHDEPCPMDTLLASAWRLLRG
jgi:hypothetical protein